ncbi:NlpC/P60 family protein [Kitasatospora sp. YST-16]|uniref:C40 family peptidase n=1 Tax=unclassified Kitasatospora TaxID=2633591 RepID=UPI0009DFB4D2|nr:MULTISPECIES: C40 family peptidase [unclassified Kitasatospora]WAL71428.1 NlpC/P60 family protein [Kitasatospora sp. YST-16]WNW37467.1 NlpC/P60 family protein [Streptomyces sp. Li-HN-5-13]
MSVPRRTPLPGVQRLARALALTAAATSALGLTVGGAHADPAPTKDQVKAQVDQLYEEAERASEQYNAALEQQRRLQAEAGTLQDQVAAGQDELNRLRGDLGAVAAAQYRAQGIDPAVRLMLDQDPAGYLTGARSLEQATARQGDRLRDVAERARRLDERRHEAGAKLTELEQARQRLAAAKDDVRERLARAQRLLNGLAPADRAGIAADDARAARQRATRGTDRIDLGDQPPSSDRAAAALAAAVSRIGSPYVYGSTGPGTFDCSGLMYWSWRQAGVTLPRTSQEQASAGRRVSLAEARPGDLVIFFNDRHHVGMYAGGGVVVHAPHPGARVRYESVSAMPVSSVVRI